MMALLGSFCNEKLNNFSRHQNPEKWSHNIDGRDGSVNVERKVWFQFFMSRLSMRETAFGSEN